MQMRKAVRARVYKFDATGEISAPWQGRSRWRSSWAVSRTP